MGLFSGKKGMILGVANDFSIAWAIAQKLLAEGAELGFTHLPGDKMERRVRKLADPIGAKLITPCDVQKDDDVARVFDLAQETYGALDFVLHSIAFAPIDDLKCPFVDASREGFKTAMDISVYSLAIVARHAARVMPEGGAIATLTYFGGERVVPGYNMMGVCKAALDAAVKYLAYDLGPKKIRVNGLSAGPVKTLAASAVGDSDKLAGLYEMSSPLERNITREEVGAAGMFLLSDLARGISGEILHVDCGYNVMGSPGRAIETRQGADPRESQGGQPRPGSLAREGRRVQATMSTRRNSPSRSASASSAADDRFLVRQRPEGTVYAGYWEFPGGKCEPGEDPAAGHGPRMPRGDRPGRRGRSAPAHHDPPLSPRPGRAVLLRLHDRDPAAEPPADSGFAVGAGRRARLAPVPGSQRGDPRRARPQQAVKEPDWD